MSAVEAAGSEILAPRATNARGLTPEEVARTFVPPAAYFELLDQGHSVLIGPRGSGKTTLLKMLTPSGLDAWRFHRAETVRSQVAFTGVFVPSDWAWRNQLAQVASGEPGMDPLLRERRTAFGIQVIRSFLHALRFRAVSDTNPELGTRFQAFASSRDQEAEFVEAVSTQYGLHTRVRQFESLENTLASAQSELGLLVLENPNPAGFESWYQRHRFANNFLGTIGELLNLYQEIFERGAERWALLFDELELAPPDLLNSIFAAQRGLDERILLKLALAPITTELQWAGDASGPQPFHDFQPVSLAHGEKRDGYNFCDAFLRARFSGPTETPPFEPEDALGQSIFDTPHKEWQATDHAYVDDSRLAVRIQEIALADRSLGALLRRKGIDPAKVSSATRVQREAVIRKVGPLAVVRADLLDFKTGRLKTTRVPTVYSGTTALYAMTEANPRWLLLVFRQFLQNGALPGKILPRAQVRAIESMSTRIRGFANLLPLLGGASVQVSVIARHKGQPRTEHHLKTVGELLDILGNYFSNQALAPDFPLDPHGTFVVGADTPEWLIEGIATLSMMGALVVVEKRADAGAAKTGGSVLNSPVGVRFRLSYLFARDYKMPIRLGTAIGLSRIVRPARPNEDLGTSVASSSTWGLRDQPGLWEMSDD